MPYINELGQEVLTEEEKRQRELAAMGGGIRMPQQPAIPQTGVNYSLAAQPQTARPQPAQPTQPVAPQSPDTYARMIQAESGGQDFDKNGQPLTSPKGAMFRAQVMPQTAANPGFGVRPAQSQTPEEYNRVGQDYYNAMLQRYGGNEQAAAAAYNAGPGRVDRNMAANGGVLNVGALPRETQGYLNKVQPGQPQVQPAAQPVQQPAQQPLSQAIDLYQQGQNDPQALMKLHYDQNVPEFIRQRAGDRVYELLDDKRKKDEAVAMIPKMGPQDIAKTLTQRSTGKSVGDWAQYLLFKHVGLTDLANEKAEQLGIGQKWAMGTDAEGKSAMIKYSANGRPLEGIDAATGQPLDQKALLSYAGGGSKLDIVGGSYVNDKTGEVGRMVTDEKTGRSYIQTDRGRKPMEGFRPQSSGGSLSDMRSRQIQELNLRLQGKTEEEKMAIVRSTNEQYARSGRMDLMISPQEVGIMTPQIAGGAPAAAGQPAPAATAQPARQPVAQPVAPGAQPVAPRPQAAPATQPASVPRPTADQLAAQQAAVQQAAKTTMDSAAAEVSKSPDTVNTLRSINKSIDIIDSGAHNIGSGLSTVVGRGPVAQAVGSQFETKDAKNTKAVMDTIQKLAADGLKLLGSNPSTVDLEFWTKYKPDASSDPTYVKEWIKTRSEDIQRRINYNRQQLGLPPVFATTADQQAYEWSKKNSNDPRARQILQKLGLEQ